MPDNGPTSHVCPRLKAILLTTVIVAFFPIIGSALYISTGFISLRERVGLRSLPSNGFLFASAYAAIASIAAWRLSQGHPLSEFNDIYLLGIVLTAYRFTWRSAAYLFVLALALSAWLDPLAPDWYRMVSFAAVSVCSIVVVARLKTIPARAAEQAGTLRREAGRDYTFLPLARFSR